MVSAIVFDFDCTITSHHVFNFLHNNIIPIDIINDLGSEMPHEMIYHINKIIMFSKTHSTNSQEQYINFIVNVLFGGIQRINKLRTLFKFIKQSNYKLIIASRGQLEDITFFLKYLDLYDYFDIILATSNHKLHIKSELLSIESKIGKEKLLDNMISSGYQNIIYIDDNPTEFTKLKHEKVTHEIGKNIYKCIFSGIFCNFIFIGTLKLDGLGMGDHEINTIKDSILRIANAI